MLKPIFKITGIAITTLGALYIAKENEIISKDTFEKVGKGVVSCASIAIVCVVGRGIVEAQKNDQNEKSEHPKTIGINGTRWIFRRCEFCGERFESSPDVQNFKCDECMSMENQRYWDEEHDLLTEQMESMNAIDAYDYIQINFDSIDSEHFDILYRKLPSKQKRALDHHIEKYARAAIGDDASFDHLMED